MITTHQKKNEVYRTYNDQTSTKQERNLVKTLTWKTNEQNPLDLLKNKWLTDTTQSSTENKVSKALITDSYTYH